MNETPGLNFDEQKVQKLKELQESGVSVYPWRFDRTDKTDEVLSKFSEISHDKSEEAVAVAGRLYTKRS
ncbi:MAG: lysine--tRNA ligase, partial [Methanocalculus sp.]|nr:lysine--tRNA ligase [Methanocalculus sp.]